MGYNRLMPKFIFRIITALIVWGIFVLVVLQIPYPDSLAQANSTQIITFFASLFLALTLTFNIFLKNILSSSAISLGLIFLFILKALDSLNLITGLLVIISAGLFVSYFLKAKRGSPPINSGFKNLTKQAKIPKLTRLRKRN